MNLDFFNKYPYTDFHELNLDYVLSALKSLAKELQDFVLINTIKYADPIQWDITRQYEKNTVVIDPLTGTAYISVDAVPAGASLARPEYWTVIFDLSLFITKANQNFTLNFETTTTTTATFSVSAGGWVVWNETLYKALVNITAGDAYVEGSNIQRYTVEQAVSDTVSYFNGLIGDLNDLNTLNKSSVVNAINEVIAALLTLGTNVGNLANLLTTDKSSIVNAINEIFTVLNNLISSVGDLATLSTTDKSSIVNAINEVLATLTTTVGDLATLSTTDKSSIVNAINEVLTTLTTLTGDLATLNTTDKSSLVNAINEVLANVGDLSDLNTTDKSSIVNAINEVLAAATIGTHIVTPEDFGAAGDGVTDDTAAVQAAFDSGADIVVIKNTYLVTPGADQWKRTLQVPSGLIIEGPGTIQLSPTSLDGYDILSVYNVHDVTIRGITVIGDLDTHTGVTGEWGYGIDIDDSVNVCIDNVNVSKCWGDGIAVNHLDNSAPIDQYCSNITISNSEVHHNRRNNISVMCGEYVNILNCDIHHASGTAPQVGIDIEPDYDALEIAKHVTVQGCHIHDNAVAGINVVHVYDDRVMNILIEGNTFYEEHAAIGGYVTTNLQTFDQDMIINNHIRCRDFAIEGSNNYNPIVKGNEFYVVASDEIPITIAGDNAVFANNYVYATTTAYYIVEMTGKYPVISNNVFNYANMVRGLLHIGPAATAATISDNKLIKLGADTTGFIISATMDDLTAKGNIVKRLGSSYSCAYFVVPDGIPSNTEMIAFNIAEVGTALSSLGATKALSNVVNGSLV